jgi:uncharacterized membrane protein
VVAVFVFLFSSFGMMGFGGYGFGGMSNMMGGYYGTGMMFFGWIFGILFFVALVLLIIWLAKQISHK